MAIALRQSTASQEVPLGPFLDITDANTEETAITLSASEILIWKTGATSLVAKNSGDATHMQNGIFYAVLDATDTNTIGPLVIFARDTAALWVRLECVVYDEAVYDSLFGTTALSTYAGGAVASVTGNVGGNVTGSVGSVASGGITAASLASDTITAAKIAADAITAAKIADGAIDAATFAAGAITAAAIASDAITDAKVASDVTIASVTGAVGSVTGNVGGNVTGSVGSVASGGITAASFGANAITAAKLDPDVTTELQAGLATASALTTVDTVVDSILARLSTLPTKTGAVVDDAANSATTFETDLTESADDHYKDCLLKFTSGSLAEQVKKITAYNGTTKFVTVSGGFTAEPTAADTFEIVNE